MVASEVTVVDPPVPSLEHAAAEVANTIIARIVRTIGTAPFRERIGRDDVMRPDSRCDGGWWVA